MRRQQQQQPQHIVASATVAQNAEQLKPQTLRTACQKQPTEPASTTMTFVAVTSTPQSNASSRNHAPPLQFGSHCISPDSHTPYSDATGGGAASRRSGKKKSKSGGIRRPMNAFMVWSQLERRRVSAVDPRLHNAEISRRLGARWRRLSAAERRPYIDEAEKLRVLHAIEFPDYKYAPRKSRRRQSDDHKQVGGKGGRQLQLQRQKQEEAALASKIVEQKNGNEVDLPDLFDSEVSSYFANINGERPDDVVDQRRHTLSQVRPSRSKRRRVDPDEIPSTRRSLPPTPDSSGYQQGHAFRTVRTKQRRRNNSSSSSSTTQLPRFCFDFRLSAATTASSSTAADWNDYSDDLGTPISLDLDTPRSAFSATVECSDGTADLTTDDGCAYGSLQGFVIGESTGSGINVYMESPVCAAESDSGFCPDYCTPEVAEMVRDDWLEENILYEESLV